FPDANIEISGLVLIRRDLIVRKELLKRLSDTSLGNLATSQLITIAETRQPTISVDDIEKSRCNLGLIAPAICTKECTLFKRKKTITYSSQLTEFLKGSIITMERYAAKVFEICHKDISEMRIPHSYNVTKDDKPSYARQ